MRVMNSRADVSTVCSGGASPSCWNIRSNRWRSTLPAGGTIQLADTTSRSVNPVMLDKLLTDPQGQLTPLRGSKLWQLAALNLWLSEQGI